MNIKAALTERRIEQLIAKPDAVAPVGADVLWLWGRLREFRERGLLQQTPEQLADTATEHMIAEIGELAPIVGSWLLRWGKF